MVTYCSRCRINWARLGEETRDDETYEYCPECKTDFFLEEAREGDVYAFKVFQGIINLTTGQPYRPNETPVTSVRKEKRPFDLEAHIARVELREKTEDLAIEEYQRVFAIHGQEAAKTKFFEILKQKSS